jgi:hypothetical protein
MFQQSIPRLFPNSDIATYHWPFILIEHRLWPILDRGCSIPFFLQVSSQENSLFDFILYLNNDFSYTLRNLFIYLPVIMWKIVVFWAKKGLEIIYVYSPPFYMILKFNFNVLKNDFKTSIVLIRVIFWTPMFAGFDNSLVQSGDVQKSR